MKTELYTMPSTRAELLRVVRKIMSERVMRKIMNDSYLAGANDCHRAISNNKDHKQ